MKISFASLALWIMLNLVLVPYGINPFHWQWWAVTLLIFLIVEVK